MLCGWNYLLVRFYKYFFAQEGYMDYALGMRDLFFSMANSEDAKMETTIYGKVSDYIRLPGPLSHNNVTGLSLAIGALLSFSTI